MANPFEDSSPENNKMNIKFEGAAKHPCTSNNLPNMQNTIEKLIKGITSSAVLATESKPINAKKTVADPASMPSTPKGKYLLSQE